MRRCSVHLPILLTAALMVSVIGCDQFGGSKPAPSCEEVVAHSDQLAIEWARNQSKEKGDRLEKLIDDAKSKAGTDKAVQMCRDELTDDQKRCVIRAETLSEKNECLGLETDR